MNTKVDSFRIDVPAAWRELPLDVDSLRGAITDAKATLRDLPVAERRRIELYLLRLLSDFESVNAQHVAVLNESFPSADGDGPIVPLIAAVIVSVVSQEEIGSPIPLTPAAVVAALSMDSPASGKGQRGLRTTNLVPPMAVQLPHVTAVRMRRLVEHDAVHGEALTMATDTYFVPVPDEFQRMVVAQFSTPNLADASALSELFAAIAATLRFYREGEETTL